MKSITSKQMAYVDELMINHYGITLLQMMENAGLGLAMMTSKVINYNKNSKIVILVGKGNNGGDGLVAARHLHNFGYDVRVILANRSLRQVPLQQLNILKKIKVPIYNYNNKKNNKKNSIYYNNIIKNIENSNLIVDTLLGYNAKGNPYGTIKELIKLANKSKGKILSVDLPSGLDPDTGKIYCPCIKANFTLMLSYPKKGLMGKNARKYTGKLFISYLTIPRELSRKLKFKIRDFSQDLFAYL